MMAITQTRKTVVRRLNDDELRAEIQRLLGSVGMDRRELFAKGEAFELDATQRSVLADVEAMEWMLAAARR